ncbi:hypothetical protein A3F28_00645 [Candidatus Uhrbacteria bacterium RIFCSPHIGHO2_12_FULL_57_11]|uniref:Dephospho-CoA kinase n=2 Tax=Candidatus Uhriibacteriota TaxID=1752732 RepID=A0A1F7UQ41_9BACT|nr:MAG: hypothetical protein A3D72_04730 [Candidatus Uhrbacteria bacterium RIFCSPHIGHO2_02_FULL_57_19]OGL79807.1 MAG: hypothetical protein A3F28_00645 [Candidatus Uhrbacteria bacterium RIFCSPHIGHO2_12_FULL_57_11]
MATVIIGLVGEGGAGKGTIAAYLKEKHQAATCRFSDALNDILARLDVESTRENLIELSEILRKSFGETVIARAVARWARERTEEIIAVDGIRRMGDIETLGKLPGFHLVYVTADPKTRYERMIRRGEKAGETEMTYERFLVQEQLPTEVSIKDVAAHAEEKIDNNGGLDQLHTQVDELMHKWKS